MLPLKSGGTIEGLIMPNNWERLGLRNKEEAIVKMIGDLKKNKKKILGKKKKDEDFDTELVVHLGDYTIKI